MDDEEDDVFEPDPLCWRTTFREVKCEDRGTQTPGPALALYNGMLPCGVAEEPRPLFYGNAGFRLHFPAHFELVGDQEARRQESEEEQNGMQPPQQQPVARSVEACIGQKLQLIGDQFHREHLQLFAVEASGMEDAWPQTTQDTVVSVTLSTESVCCKMLLRYGGDCSYSVQTLVPEPSKCL
ncbi:bcl-2-modifying factor-like isoform X6 [Siniperca chuatsi]|uniref:bcl-2-modifying factor-like isoform X6 n=1 Tax=Siniperca chuatsi TaxID=119488 RepID=UPI001CE14A37|nr:bcl-2-modifying factor-like isoform X6 [Siniperca chuatsi]